MNKVRKMVKNHIKRINAPKRWDILRKENKFISRPNPGRKLDLAISLNTCLKEMLTKTTTTKETKYLLKNKGAMVNGVKRYDEKFPVGFMDVITLPELDENYRLLVNDQNKLVLYKISSAESKVKVSKVANKIAAKEEKVQVVCTDGRTFLLSKEDTAKITTNDTLVYSIPEQKIKEVLKLEEGALVFLYNGKHIGQVVNVESFKGSNILFKIGNEIFETKKTYAFVIGKDKPTITVLDPSKHSEKKK